MFENTNEIKKSTVPMGVRIEISPQGAYTLPNGNMLITIISGTAWVSCAGIDHVLRGGESLELRQSRFAPLISALRRSNLIFEIEPVVQVYPN
jgi:hypothetical protein